MGGVSDPLYALFNNGSMKESQTGVLPLKDVDVDTFVGFSEYAYTGAYKTPNLTSYEISESEFNLKANYNDRSNEERAIGYTESRLDCDLSPEPDRTPSSESDSWNFATRRKGKGKNKRSRWMPADVEPSATIVYPYEQLWERFRSLEFSNKLASPSPNPDILFHAKLYVFATKFLIEPLRQQCQGSIHRDLCKLSLDPEKQIFIIYLLKFTYAHTGRGEPSGRSRLRDLIIHYIACKVRTLADDENFGELLDSNAEMGSDLVLKLVR